MATNKLTGGAFQNAFGQPLTNGYLLLTLSTDCQVASTSQVVAGLTVKVPLDNNGNVAGGGVAVYTNDSMLPAGSYYNLQIFASDGRLVSSPATLQLTVTTSPNPFDLGVNWIP